MEIFDERGVENVVPKSKRAYLQFNLFKTNRAFVSNGSRRLLSRWQCGTCCDSSLETALEASSKDLTTASLQLASRAFMASKALSRS